MSEVLNEFIVSLAVGLVTLLSSYIIYYIRKATLKIIVETEKLDNEEQRILVQTAVERLEDVTTKTVWSIEQRTAKELRENVKTGKTSRKELKQLSEVAYQDILDQMKPEYIQVLEETLVDMEGYIKNTIEAKLLEMKEELY
jgi:hypothetical protein